MENWACWHGPRGDGTSTERDLPAEWDAATGKNILWKVEVLGSGHSSPIVWNDRLFLSTCFEERQERPLLCFDSKTGKELWRSSVLKSPLETLHKINSYALGTSATDGRLIYVALLKVGDQTVPAPNVGTPRDHGVRSYVTPIIRTIDGQDQLVLSGSEHVAGFDSADGSRIWRDRLAGSFDASLVATDRLAYFLSGDGVMKVFAPADELELVAENSVGERCHASPAISNGRLYIRGDRHLFCIGR